MLLLLGFVAVMVITFAVVATATQQSPLEKTIDQRMVLIQTLSKDRAGVAPETAQLLKMTRPTKFGWFEELLERYQFTQKLQKLILQANSRTTVGTLLMRSAGLAIFGYIVTWFFAPMAVVDSIVAVVLGLVPYGFLSFKRAKKLKAFDGVLAECIDMMARALRAGYSMPGAIEMLSENAQPPAKQEFGEVFKQQNLGLPLRDALLELLDRIPSADLQVLVTAILVQKDTGGNLAEILDRTSYVIRERLRIQGEIRVHTAQGRLTGWILSLLPAVMMLLINMVNPGYSHVLFYDPTGRKLIYAALVMVTIGSAIIHRIVNGIEV